MVGSSALSQLVVGIPDSLSSLPSMTGDARVWKELISRLEQRVAIVRIPERKLPSERPDVWLLPATTNAEVIGPVVVQINEAPLADQGSRHTLEAHHFEFESQLRAITQKASVVVVPSLSSLSQVQSRLSIAVSKIVAIPWGVDSIVFNTVPSHLDATTAQLGPYVLCVSTAHPRKNLQALRSAFMRLVEGGAPHLLVLVVATTHGFPNAEEHLHNAVADLPHPGRLKWLSRVSDHELAALYRGADVYCSPSLMEGFGLTVLEAMACGAPCVVSDRGSIPEVAGDAAIICQPTPDALSAGMARVLGDGSVRRRLAQRAVARAADHSWDSTANTWVDVLARAANADW